MEVGYNTAPLVTIGGTDISTNQPFRSSLTAPSGSSIVSPLTTLFESLVANDLTETVDLNSEQYKQLVSNAEQQVIEALGLPEQANLDLLNTDYVQAVENTANADVDDASLAVVKAAVRLGSIMEAAAELEQTQRSVARNFAALISTPQDQAGPVQIDLSNAATVGSLAHC